ncbi:MAG: hypothetical protein QNJ05_13230 [Woeseiaceae bacterium]|nr:hypothetical protein [Woeseiaceae bacterium]
MTGTSSEAGQFEKGVAQSTKKLAIWTVAWLISLAIATFGSTLVWDSSLTLKIASILINFVIGIGTIKANIRHIQSLDEMMQRVHLEALGMATGIAIVAGISLSVLSTSEVLPFKVDISILVMLLGLVYGIGTVVGMRRYK